MFALFIIITIVWLTHLLNVPFHEDEAIYAAWSLTLLREDVWLAQTLIDKPPLTFYPMALSIGFFGRYEWAARLPNLFWGALLLTSCWRIAKHYRASGKLVVFFMLLSPLLWAQAASAFTDLAMLALVFLAIERAVKGQPQLAGGAFGLACLAKPTALLLLPLTIIGLLVEQEWKRADVATKFSRFVAAFALPVLLAWAWDASRSAPSWWVLGTQAYGTLGQLNVAQIEAWLYIFLLSLGPLLLLSMMAFLYEWMTGVTSVRVTLPHQRLQLALAVTSILWVPTHLLLGFQPWERYLLPLVPIMALFFALHDAAISHAAKNESHSRAFLARFGGGLAKRGGAFVYGSVLLCVPFLIQPFQLEPHDGRWEGIREIGAIIETLPREAVVYYFETGRPLAWYAANAKASLIWAESDHHLLPSQSNQPSYLVIRITHTLPATLTNKSPSGVAQSGHFRLLKINP